VWMVAAALRQYIVQQHRLDPGAADAAISAAAAAMIGAYDEGQTLECAAMRLATALLHRGRLDGPDLVRMLKEGLLPLFVAAVGARCSLDYAASWEVLCDPQGRGPALLLRFAGIARPDAAAILLLLNARGLLFSASEGDAAAAQLDLFDDSTEAEALDVLRLWQVDPGYRAAIAQLSTRRQAPVAT